MDRQSSATRSRRGWVGVLLMMVGAAVSQPALAVCNGNPNARIDPTTQTVPESTGGSPTAVSLNGTASTPNNGELQFAWQYLGSTPSGLSVTLNNANAATAGF